MNRISEKKQKQCNIYLNILNLIYLLFYKKFQHEQMNICPTVFFE